MTQESEEENPDRVIEHQLDVAYKLQRKAWERVFNAVLAAKEAGWSNQDIGYVLGMSEGGVRMMLKRRSGRMYQRQGAMR
jgi:DNA-directed RNA polymerase specialized sigma24 family protein